MTITELDVNLPAELLAAWDTYQARWQHPVNSVFPVETLHRIAEEHDVTLCAWCSTPHEVTVRSCCGDAHCENHESDHDIACPDFVAQLREEAL